MSEQQVLNYLYWLKDRGQSFAFAPTFSPIATEDSSERSDIPPAYTSTAVRLLFVTMQTLREDEAEMIMRIAAALGLRSSEFSISLVESASTFAPEFTVMLGGEELESDKVLSIPHPSEMLKDPSLKISAWQKLQQFKAKLF